MKRKNQNKIKLREKVNYKKNTFKLNKFIIKK